MDCGPFAASERPVDRQTDGPCCSSTNTVYIYKSKRSVSNHGQNINVHPSQDTEPTGVLQCLNK